MEVRTINFDSSNLSFDDDNLHVSGLVNQAGSKSQVISEDGLEFIETIDPKAFILATANPDHPIDFYEEHDPSMLLATTANDSLQLNADMNGLSMDATMVDTQIARDAYQYIKSGIIKGMSFGFIVLDDKWDDSGDIPFRTVTELELFEVSAVRFPAYLASDIEARGFKSVKDFEKRGFNAVSNIKLKKEGRNLDLSKISDEDLKKEFNKRSLGKDSESQAKKRAYKNKEDRDSDPLTADDAAALISSVFGDDFTNNLVSQIIDNFNSQLGDFLNGVADPNDEDRAGKQFNIVPVKPAKRDDDNDDEPLETDSRSIKDFTEFLNKAETHEGEDK